jgi:hypothetical protein
LKLNIYYEDLNYENLTEVPEIEVMILSLDWYYDDVIVQLSSRIAML